MYGREFDWDHLRYFLAVARTGRLTAAAAQLRQDHATVSRRVAALEASLGVPLFERSLQGYRLTEFGLRLMPTAETMERGALAALHETRGDDPPVSGTVRIGAPDGFGSAFLARRIAKLCEAFPRLTVELVAMPRIFSLSRREADIAIGLSRPSEGRLHAVKLTDYRLGLYAAPDYLARRPVIETVEDLRSHTLIGYVEDFIFTPELDYLPLIAPGLAPQIRSSNLVAQYAAAVSGAGICVLPYFMASAEPGLVPVLGDTVSLTRTFWLVTHADLHALPRIRATSEFIARQVAENRTRFLPGG
ncbi:MAG TPA: LysR family transcriptional regulator [Stellaceae bacterium]|nr:LysR family transcriptional regulator [Stellaceae bacterium]